jgi:D-xylose reductase
MEDLPPSGRNCENSRSQNLGYKYSSSFNLRRQIQAGGFDWISNLRISSEPGFCSLELPLANLMIRLGAKIPSPHYSPSFNCTHLGSDAPFRYHPIRNFVTTPSMTDLKLHSGDTLPSVGLGLWKVANEDAPRLVQDAIEVGYRHFDLACDYGNEVEAGQGIRAAIDAGLCKREDLWITSKLWNTYHAKKHVRAACEKSLGDLGLDYLDLYLIHFPIAQKFVPFEERYPPAWFADPDADNPRVETAAVPISETWGAMEELVDAGLTKNIGVCNFGTSLLRDLLSYARIKPAVLQVESHPYLTQEKLLRYCAQEGIAYTAFSPLGALSYFALNMAEQNESVIQEPAVKAIAESVGRSPAQVLLRWGVQRGTAVVPKTSKRERLIENLAIFDFELSADDMQAIATLNRTRRFNDPGDFCEAAFNTFFPIYE